MDTNTRWPLGAVSDVILIRKWAVDFFTWENQEKYV